jgi:hypothetical protein
LRRLAADSKMLFSRPFAEVHLRLLQSIEVLGSVRVESVQAFISSTHDVE